MSRAPLPTQAVPSTTMPSRDQLRSIIQRLDVILAELDRAQLRLPVLNVASAILKLQHYRETKARAARYSLRSTT